ncbi:right-handed parallel beta-helix repeat-containing protein [Vallitalea pronyensis]|uniref:Right-handed parallel beta-helix repeat-containing protein n=1 Tax=Vallitalea pronyensis TaxID=1348613 RepID=A0A8J8MJD9_9FIRM|nr:sugar-binding protein [Vallitalea pronyensis]QUI22749.1 right-handed parallel beta-helix repeat-containing protein [Vallitalea pronyensis]
MKLYRKTMVMLMTLSIVVGSFTSLDVDAAYHYSTPVEKELITGSDLSVNNPEVTLYVSVNGDDDNNGKRCKPLASIQAAILKASGCIDRGKSTRIIVREGVYILDSMISLNNLYPAANDFLHIVGQGEVVITGAREWTDWDRENGANIYSKDWHYRWGKVNNTYEGRIPEALQYREIAFVNEEPMVPVRSYEALRPGTMFVSETEGRIFIYPDEAVHNLNDEKVEVSESGGFINLNGLAMGNLMELNNIENLMLENLNFEKAAAGVSDAVSIQQGKNIVIKDCTFSSSAYNGLRFDDVENGLIDNCHASYNGGKGIAVSNGKNIIVKDSTTDGNNWFGHPYGWIQWDPAGMKIFRAHEMRIINHSSSDNLCEGIWADTDIINMYIENPTIVGNKNHGLWIEANVGPVYVENGRVEENKNFGLYNSSTENLFLDGVTFKNNKGEVAIGDFNTKGRGPLVSDPVWAGDYGNTFGNFETGEGFVSHAVDMTIENCTFVGSDLSETPLFIYVKSDDKDSYKPWMDSLTANNNTYSHFNPEKAFYVATSGSEGAFVNFTAWQTATSQDGDSVFTNEGIGYSEEQPPSGVTSGDVSPKPGQRVVQASKANQAPVIDGIKDDVWDTTTTIISDYEFENQDKDNGVVNATGIASLLWDENYLYFIVTVDDANPTRGTDSNWQCDNVEVFLDQNYNQSGAYESDDGQYRIGHDGERSGKTLTWDLSALEEYAAVINDDNYVVEGKIKVNHVSMVEGRVMGFDYQIADEREVAGVYGRRGIQMWNDKTANGYNSTANWGYLELVNSAVDVATIPEPLFVESMTTDIPSVLEIGSEHDITIDAVLSDGTQLTKEQIELGSIVYGSADQSILRIDTNGHMTGLSSGKTMVSVRFTYEGSTKTVVSQVVVPGTLSAFDYQDISPQLDKVHEYVGKITLYPYGCEWMTSGTELVFYGVDFGDEDTNLPYLNYQIQGHAIGEEMAGGKIEFRIDSPDNEAFGAVIIEDTSEKLDDSLDDWHYDNSRLMAATMSQNVTGKHTLYMRFVGEPGNETHANLRMGKFYWANFYRSDTPIIQQVTEKKMVDLFHLDFEDNSMSTYGSFDIHSDSGKVATLQINASGSDSDVVEVRDGALYFEKDNGPADNDYGQIQLALSDIQVPESDMVVISYDVNALNWTMEDKWQDFPKVVFEKEDNTIDYGVLIMENANGIGGNFAPGAWNQVNYKDQANLNRIINFRYEFNMNNGSYKVYKDDVEWVSNGQVHTAGTEFIPKALDSFIFKIQKAIGDEKQQLSFDNIKVSYLTEVK